MNEQMALEWAIRARNNQFASVIDATIRKIREMKQHFAGMANSIYSHARKVAAAVAKMHAAIKKLNNAFRTLRNVALKAFTAIVALNGIPIKFFADFEQKMANVNTLLDVSEQKFQQMGQGVIDISNKIGESATTLSTALYDIVSAGVDASDSLQVLDTSARAAKAGMTNAQTAVNAGLATINAYNLEIQDLSHVYDLQFQTVRKGVITYEQLASAQGQLLPSARKLNESLENMYGALSYVTKAGLSADMASISLARAFDGLTTKADKLAKYGIEVYDEFGKFRGLLPIMEDFSESLEGLTNEQMMDTLNNIGFDIRAARSIIPMITNIDGLRESIEAMNESSGAMETAFEKATNTISFHFNRAKENVINSFREMGQGWREEIITFLDNVAALGGALQDFVIDNKDAIKSITAFALKLAGLVALAGVVGSAIFALMTPIGVVIAGVAALGAMWYLNMWDIRGWTEDAVNFVLDKWEDLKKWWNDTTWLEKAQTIAKVPLQIAEWGWSALVDIYESLWNWMLEEYDINDDGKLSLAETIRPFINIANWLWEAIKPIRESLWNKINELFGVKPGESITFDKALHLALDFTVDTFNSLGNVGSQLWGWLNNNDGSIEEQLENQIGNSGLGELLKSIYVAEGQDTATWLYGTRGFAEKGYQFGKQANQEFFDGLVEAMNLESHSKEWLAASAATTVTHYWENFKDKYDLEADTALADLNQEMRNKFIEYLGSGYAPQGIEGHENNVHWVPNVNSQFEKELQATSVNGTGVIKNGITIWASLKLARETASLLIEAIRTALNATGVISAVSSVGGVTMALGVATIAIELAENLEKGSFEDFGANIATALALGLGIGAFTGSPQAGALAFTIAVNLELGKVITDDLMPQLDAKIIQPVREIFKQVTGQQTSSEVQRYIDIMNNPGSTYTPDAVLEASPSTWEEFMRTYKELWVNPWLNMMDDKSRGTWWNWLGFAEGGKISGPGTSTSDSIPAMLSNGEFVINAEATRKWLPFLQAINNGQVPGFKYGGIAHYRSGDYVSQNIAVLDSADLEGLLGKALTPLFEIAAKGANDTENFKNMVNFVAGIDKLVGSFGEGNEKFSEAIKEILNKFFGIDINGGGGPKKEESWIDIIKEAIDDSKFMNQFSNFLTNLGQVTGSDTLGLAGSLVGNFKQGWDAFQGFQSAPGMLGKLTSGFGIANAALGAVSAITSFVDADQEKHNQEQERLYEKQNQIAEEQLEKLQEVAENTKDTVTNLIKALSANPTTSNILEGKNVLTDMLGLFQKGIGYGFSDISMMIAEQDWDTYHHVTDKHTRIQDPMRFINGYISSHNVGRSLLPEFSYIKDTSQIGSLIDMNLDDPLEKLREFNRQVQALRKNDFKDFAYEWVDQTSGGEDYEWFKFDGLKTFQRQLSTYVDMLEKLVDANSNLAEYTRLESFTGVEWLNHSEAVEQYKEQLTEMYENAGLDVDKYKSRIEQLAEKMAGAGESIITIMQQVRGSFISAFSEGTSLIQSFADGARQHFNALKENISSLFYDIELDKVDAQFEEVFEDIVNQLANYSGDDVLGFAEQLLSGNDIESLFDSIINLQQTENNISDINEMLAEQFRAQAEAAGLGDSEISDLIERLGFAAEDAADSLREFAGDVKNAPSGFKQERFGYDAAFAESGDQSIDGGTLVTGNTFILRGQTVEELIAELKKIDKNEKLQSTGTTTGNLAGG